ncbi:hypothetical protein DFH27DRAFT_117513 [Peziza echinospora]|nr:hypothetical protein DFH27DRAFT_117513 [Peziza echinospora]
MPMTGYFRDGFCDTDPTDVGNHSVAGVMTSEFLKFSADRGNDLRAVPGMKQGTEWCLCATRWKEVHDAYKRGEVTRDTVPPVDLAATHERALNTVAMNDLRGFALLDTEGSTKEEEDQYKGRRRRIGTMTGTVQT